MIITTNKRERGEGRGVQWNNNEAVTASTVLTTHEPQSFVAANALLQRLKPIENNFKLHWEKSCQPLAANKQCRSFDGRMKQQTLLACNVLCYSYNMEQQTIQIVSFYLLAEPLC